LESKQKKTLKVNKEIVGGPQKMGMPAADFRFLLLRASVAEIHDKRHFVFSYSNARLANAVLNHAD
jgi:hypothetical protein